MISISSISGYSDYSAYGTIARGGRISKASEGASELAIQEKTESQVRGLDTGAENLKDAKSVLNIEDGALGQVTDYLQSIRQLSLQAMNGTMSDDDKASIQNKIDQYKQGINDIAGGTTYNEKKLLDGSAGNMTVASDNNGSTETVGTYNMATQALGIDDFDVTGDFDISRIDDALSKVTDSRTNAGAQTNAIDYALTYNSHAAMELNGFQMDSEESRSVEALQKLKSQQVMDVYQTQMQKKKMEDEQQKAMSVFV